MLFIGKDICQSHFTALFHLLQVRQRSAVTPQGILSEQCVLTPCLLWLGTVWGFPSWFSAEILCCCCSARNFPFCSPVSLQHTPNMCWSDKSSHAETSIQLWVFQCTGLNLFKSPSFSLQYKYSNLRKWVSYSCKQLRMSNVWFSCMSPVRPHWTWAI